MYGDRGSLRAGAIRNDGGKLMAREWTQGGLMFGKMWEDPLVERALLPDARGPTSVFCVASAGDTAFALAADPRLKVEACDLNPAQIHLCHLKLELLRANRLVPALASDARRALDEVEAGLPQATRDYWERHRHTLSRGLNRAGRVDRVMATGAFLLRTLWARRGAVEELLNCHDPQRQAELVRRDWSGTRWTWAFRLALHPWLLRAVYGRRLCADLPRHFPALMQNRMEQFLGAFPPCENPYLWQTLAGQDGPTRGAPYLREWGEVSFHHASVTDYLAERPQAFDFLALSNILEVATPHEIEAVARAVIEAARPGALICLRFIVPRAPVFSRLELLQEQSQRCGQLDRAFFCNHFQIYRA